MRSTTSSWNPVCRERRNITDGSLRAAVLVRFVTAGCTSKSQARGTKLSNVRSPSTVQTFHWTSLMWNQARAAVLCTFCRPHFRQKCCEPVSFFEKSTCKSKSRCIPAHFLLTTFADRGPYPQKQGLHFSDPGSHFNRENKRLSRNGFIHDFLRFVLTLPRRGVDMMRHEHDETAPGRSSVTGKFSN